MLTRQEELAWLSNHCSVTVEDGGLQAILLLDEGLRAEEDNLPLISFEALTESLRQRNITYGIDMILCHQILMNPAGYLGRKLTIASGQPAKHGENANIEILVNMDEHLGPQVLEDGRVDYFNLGIVRTVLKGQLLARKTPPTEGVHGISVSGAVLQAKNGRDVRLPQGKNTTASEDGLQLFAETDGHVSYNARENKISVFDVFEVKGDVDYSVGNIDFLGNVKVNGSVLPGFKIIAAGDIEVVGYVDGAVLEAGGDILVRGGVQMRSSGLIKAGGTVRSRFLQGATVEAGVDVCIRDSIMHSHVSAGRHILMESQKGVIVGGTVRCGETVRTRTMGSPMATPTEVEVGVHPHLRLEIAELHAKLKDLYLNIDKTKKALAILDNMAGYANQLSPEKEAMRQKLQATYGHYLQEEEELMFRRSEIEAQLLDTRLAKVFCAEIVFAGVKLTLGQEVSFIRDPLRGPVKFEITEGEISHMPF